MDGQHGPAGKASPSGGKGSTETTHLEVKKNNLTRTTTSDGSKMSEAKLAY